MNLLHEIAIHGGLFLDIAGILGLALLALAAVRLARIHRSWGGALMGWGAAALLAGRVYVLIAPQVLSRELLASLGRSFISASVLVPVLLLTAGFAAVVWGLWGHERWLKEN
jgi:hypothetical protein